MLQRYGKKMFIGLLTAAFILTIALSPGMVLTARASATIYVNSATGNDGNDGSSGNPYKTFHKGYTMTPADGTLDLTGTFTWTDIDEDGDAAMNGYTIGKNITIQGQELTGQTVLRSAVNSSSANCRVLTITDPAVTVTLRNLTITGGNTGGGGGGISIYGGSVQLTNCTIRNNACLYNGGGISVTGGSVELMGCTVSNNTATDLGGGGGISAAMSGQLVLTGCTVNNNNAATSGGGIEASMNALLRMENTTVYANFAPFCGGVQILSSIPSSIVNCTIAYNTDVNIVGGLRRKPNNQLNNSIVANNVSSVGENNILTTDGVTDIDDDNIIGNQANLNLSTALSNNGGLTQTLALYAGSSAIDAGDTDAAPTTDQRGMTRDAAPDIGAYEYILPSVTAATLSADTGTSSTDFITRTENQTLSGTLSRALITGEKVQFSLDDGGTWTDAVSAAGSNAWSAAVTLPNGSNTLKIRVADTAGFTDPIYIQAYTLDTTQPSNMIESCHFSNDTGVSSTDFITKTASQQISGNLSEMIDPGEYVEVSLNNGATWTLVSPVPGSDTWSLSGQTLLGSNTLQVRVTDTAGNSRPAYTKGYTLDTTAPSNCNLSSYLLHDTGVNSNDFVTNIAAQVISGMLDAIITSEAYVEVSLDNGATWSTVAMNAASDTWSFPAQLLMGSNTLQVRVTDTAGNSNIEALVHKEAYTLDTTAPAVTGVDVPANGTYTAGQELDFTVRFDENAYVNTTGGTPFLTAYIGASPVQAAYFGGSGTQELVFRYTAVSGDADMDGILVGALLTLNGGAIIDNAGNTVGLALAGPIWQSPVFIPASSGEGAAVEVNGKSYTVGSSQSSTDSQGRTVTTVTVDNEKLLDILEAEGQGAIITLPVTSGLDIVSGVLTGEMLNVMREQGATLVIQTPTASYTLPAAQLDLAGIALQLGDVVSPADITVTVTISEPSAAMVEVVDNAAGDGGFTLLVPPVSFDITCAYGGKTVRVTSFAGYVERVIAIPDGVDPAKVTTALVVDPDGMVRSVPTQVTLIDGKYYAVISSMTNSIYTVIYNPVEFTDVTGHWAAAAINSMGACLIVTGDDALKYEPDTSITRAEFATILVRALGLEPGKGDSTFTDLNVDDPNCGYIETLVTYGIVRGYGDGRYGPDDTVTREQAMVMLTGAMGLTGMPVNISDSEIKTLLSGYADAGSASDYAKAGIALCLRSGLVTGKSTGLLDPKTFMSRAETAVLVERLLMKSGLI